VPPQHSTEKGTTCMNWYTSTDLKCTTPRMHNTLPRFLLMQTQCHHCVLRQRFGCLPLRQSSSSSPDQAHRARHSFCSWTGCSWAYTCSTRPYLPTVYGYHDQGPSYGVLWGVLVQPLRRLRRRFDCGGVLSIYYTTRIYPVYLY
jgi:hypothetical protein